MKYDNLNEEEITSNRIVFSLNNRGQLWPAIISPCPYGEDQGDFMNRRTNEVWVEYFDDYTGAWVSRNSLKKFESNPYYYNEKYCHAYVEALNWETEINTRHQRHKNVQLCQLYHGSLVLAKHRNMPPWPARVESETYGGDWKRSAGRLRSSTLVHVSFINRDIKIWLPCSAMCMYQPGERFGGRLYPGSKLYKAYADAFYTILLFWEQQNGLEHYDIYEHILSPRQNVLNP